MKEISCAIVYRDKKILMQFDEQEEVWNLPQDLCAHGELGADTAERVVEEVTGCESQVKKYKRELKTEFDLQEDHFLWQPFTIEIDGDASEAEWVSLEGLQSRELGMPLRDVKDDLEALLG